MVARKKVARRKEVKEVEEVDEVKEKNRSGTDNGVGLGEFRKRKRESEARGFK
ncbi:MAG: hypothetical protein WA857_17430 [Candidatus Acidiferrum sp.]